MSTALELAKAFRQRKHFSREAWLNRGLNPSPADVCTKLNMLLIRSTDRFIESIEAEANPDELRAVLKKGLDSFSESDFDTEEKEYICELIYELGQMVGIDMSFEANSFLYGPGLAEMLAKQVKTEPVEILQFTCTGCDTKLKLNIVRKKAGIPEGWLIASCNICSELNLLKFGKDVKELSYDNFSSKISFHAGNTSKDEVLKIFNEMKRK